MLYASLNPKFSGVPVEVARTAPERALSEAAVSVLLLNALIFILELAIPFVSWLPEAPPNAFVII